MYEEYNEININWLQILLKLCLILVIILVVGYIINRTIINDKPEVINDTYNNNFALLESISLDYYMDNNLPNNLNESLEISLNDLIDLGLIEKASFEVNSCSLDNSHSKITYIGNNQYNIKVSLDCLNNTEYTIETITINDL